MGGAYDPQIRTLVGFLYSALHVTAKFHHPTFNRLEVIMSTDKQTDAAENIHLTLLCYAGG